MMYSLIMVFTLLFQQPTVYDYSFTTLDGKKVSMEEFKGKQILIVNTASKCGFTPQYKQLQELYEKYGDQLVVIGFPSDNFKEQEFDTSKEIAAFCEKNYGVKFLLSEKVDVTGDKMAPLFKYLTTAKNPDFTGAINWNFEKFLIGRDGRLEHRYRSKVTPMDESIIKNL